MRFDIAPIKGKYRGMERTIGATELWRPKTNKIYSQLLEKYFLYLRYIELCDDDSFKKTIDFYKELCDYDIICEVITYATHPLEQAYGYPIEFLGIDIVHDMCESLIADEINETIKHFLNENGLCDTEEDAIRIIPFQDHGNVEWIPCYVYKIVISDFAVDESGIREG